MKRKTDSYERSGRVFSLVLASIVINTSVPAEGASGVEKKESLAARIQQACENASLEKKQKAGEEDRTTTMQFPNFPNYFSNFPNFPNYFRNW